LDYAVIGDSDHVIEEHLVYLPGQRAGLVCRSPWAIEQMIALCPNGHAIKTRGPTRERLRDELLLERT
jgi:hypothetical protein